MNELKLLDLSNPYRFIWVVCFCWHVPINLVVCLLFTSPHWHGTLLCQKKWTKWKLVVNIIRNQAENALTAITVKNTEWQSNWADSSHCLFLTGDYNKIELADTGFSKLLTKQSDFCWFYELFSVPIKSGIILRSKLQALI